MFAFSYQVKERTLKNLFLNYANYTDNSGYIEHCVMLQRVFNFAATSLEGWSVWNVRDGLLLTELYRAK